MNALVVDDEAIVRAAIKTLVHWEKYRINNVYEAGNGAEALKIIGNTHIDILFTDIKMPVMDGISLLKELKENDSNMAVVVLSCYDDFCLVREAFRFQIKDYILKTEMNEEKLSAIIENIIKGNNFKSPNENINKVNRTSSLNDYLKSLLFNENYIPTFEDNKLLTEYGLDLNHRYLVAGNLKIDGSERMMKQKAELEVKNICNMSSNLIDGFMNKIDNGITAKKEDSEYIIILWFDNVSGDAAIYTKIYDIFNHIGNMLKKTLGITVSTGLSNIISGSIKDNACQLYIQSNKAADIAYISGIGKIYFYKDIVFSLKKPLNGIGEKIRIVSSILHNAEKFSSFDILKNVLISSDGLSPDDVDEVKQLYKIYASLLSEYINERNLQDSAKDSFLEMCSYIPLADTLDDANKLVENLFTHITGRNEKIENLLVKRVMRYISENYYKNMSLDDAAKEMGVSKEHLCRTMSNNMGCNFTKLLLNIRTEKAKEYLTNTDLKIYEVAEKVGYSNYESFSRVFKSVTGKSPKEFIQSPEMTG